MTSRADRRALSEVGDRAGWRRPSEVCDAATPHPAPGPASTHAQETYDYNNRLQPVRIQLGTASNHAADYCLVYNDYAGVGNPASCAIPAQATSGDNGNVVGYLYQDSVNSSLSHTASHTYDALNRLTGATATGNATYSLNYSYDYWGNMNCTGGTGLCTALSYNNANRLTYVGTSPVSYDGAGDLTNDGQHTYQYDAEGRMTSIDSGSTGSIAYNALGQGVDWLGQGFRDDNIRDPRGQWAGRWSVAYSTWTDAGEFHVGAQPMALYVPSGTWFVHNNAVGSTTIDTDQSGSPFEDVLFYPWGQFWTATVWDEYHFSTFDDYYPPDLGPAPFRQYANRLGRWMTPDPLAGDLTNPQSLNRYAYVLNNPTTLIDPLGLRAMPCQLVDTVAPAGCGDGGGNDFGGYTVDGQPVANSVGQAVQAGGFGCVGSCTSSVTGSNGKTYTVVQTAGTPDIYAPNGELLYPDLRSLAEVGLEQAYARFAEGFPFLSGADPNSQYTLQCQRRGFTPNCQVLNGAGGALGVKPGALSWGRPDLFGGHNGNPSSYFISGPLGIDAFHLVDVINPDPSLQGEVSGAEFHSEFSPFGPFAPIHFFDWMASHVPGVGVGTWQPFTCSLLGGCH